MNEPKLKEHLFDALSDESPTETEESIHSSDFDFDITEDTLKHIFSKSPIKKKLAYILSVFYKNPILIILFSIIIGFLFFTLPLLFSYFNIFLNFAYCYCIMIIIALFLFLLIITIRIIDDKQYKINVLAKWERKILLNNCGTILILILICAEIFLLTDFFDEILYFKDENKLNIIYEPDEEEYVDKKDKLKINNFFLKYVINCFLLKIGKIKNEETKVSNHISDTSILKEIIHKLCLCTIPLLIYSFNKLIQTIIIKVKYTIPKLFIFPCSIGLCIIIIILNFDNKEKEEDYFLSFLEMVFITFIFFGYLFLCSSSIWRRFKKPKDKNFGINKYDLFHLILIFIIDLIHIFGTLFMFISILVDYINFNVKDETFHDIKLELRLLTYGSFFFIVTNSFYYGHYVLALIFRPIALQYSPIKLKENYIRASRNLSSYIFI